MLILGEEPASGNKSSHVGFGFQSTRSIRKDNCHLDVERKGVTLSVRGLDESDVDEP